MSDVNLLAYGYDALRVPLSGSPLSAGPLSPQILERGEAGACSAPLRGNHQWSVVPCRLLKGEDFLVQGGKPNVAQINLVRYTADLAERKQQCAATDVASV